MSEYTNYSEISKTYDTHRSAVGSHIYVGRFLTSLQKRLKDVHLLDAGCGTGNYAVAMLEAGVGKVSLLDANDGMLARAKEKTEPFVHSGRIVDFRQHCLPTLPYESGTFDAVMVNNVIHHMETTGFTNVEKFLHEASRVMVPGGLLIIQHSFPRQVEESYWSFHLAPKAMEEFSKRFIGHQPLTKFLLGAGFRNVEFVVPTTALAWGPNAYFNEDGPLDPVVRKSESFWESVSAEEMKEAEKKVMELKASGQMKNYITENDKNREDIGQITVVFATKQ